MLRAKALTPKATSSPRRSPTPFWDGRPPRMNAIKRYLVALAFAASPLLAQETEAAAKANGTLLYWKIANFLILGGLIGWLVVKEGGPALHTRSQAIGEGLAAGEKAKAEAEERATQVNAKLANLANEIAVMQTQAREELARESD